ncbi:MAG: hypothetical protein WCM76_04540 [Bacteroidota bacterium]
MKSKSVYFALLLFVISNSLMSQTFDFRNTKWGMDTTMVKKAEASKLVIVKKNHFVYKGKLNDWDAKIIYDFNSAGLLYHASYDLTLDSKIPSAYVDTYLMLQELLTRKYKEPYSSISTSINGKTLKQDEWAFNLISDNLSLETKWKSNNTDIVLTLYSINDELFIEISYTSIDQNNKEKEAIKSEILKAL